MIGQWLRSLVRRLTGRYRARKLTAWLKAHSVSGVIADDSRESIYTREDDYNREDEG